MRFCFVTLGIGFVLDRIENICAKRTINNCNQFVVDNIQVYRRTGRHFLMVLRQSVWSISRFRTLQTSSRIYSYYSLYQITKFLSCILFYFQLLVVRYIYYVPVSTVKSPIPQMAVKWILRIYSLNNQTVKFVLKTSVMAPLHWHPSHLQ